MIELWPNTGYSAWMQQTLQGCPPEPSLLTPDIFTRHRVTFVLPELAPIDTFLIPPQYLLTSYKSQVTSAHKVEFKSV